MLDLLKLASVFVLIIGLLRFRWNLGLILLLASAWAGLLFGLSLVDIALDSLRAAIDPLTLSLIAIVLLIAFMGEILSSTFQLEGLVSSLGDLFVDRRWLLALMPMLIGMLPMVGGAMFSAPMVQEASRGLGISDERKTFVNYWFRHALETVFPLYPSLVLAAGLMAVPVRTVSFSQLPLFLAAITGGVLFGLAGIARPNPNDRERCERKDALLLLGKSIWPIALVLSLSLVLRLDLILSLLVTIAALVIVHRLPPRDLLAALKRIPLGAASIIAGTMVFRGVLESSGAIAAASEAFAALGIPLPAIVITIPLPTGLLTGLALPAFAIGFPIVFPLCGPDLIGTGYAQLAYAGGYVGLLLSPLHLCLTLTKVYFGAEWGGVYRHIIPAAALVVLAAALVLVVRS